MITEDYVSFETAKLLKEKRFNGNTHMLYDEIGFRCSHIEEKFSFMEHIECPTQDMAMKWLKKVHYLHITVHPGVSEYGVVWTYAIVFVKEAGKGETYFYKINQITTPIVKSKSPEEACEAAIKYCLEHLI